MKTYEISEEIVRGMLAYLETKPYKEVAAGIAALLQLKEIRSEKPEKKTDKEDSKVLN